MNFWGRKCPAERAREVLWLQACKGGGKRRADGGLEALSNHNGKAGCVGKRKRPGRDDGSERHIRPWWGTAIDVTGGSHFVLRHLSRQTFLTSKRDHIYSRLSDAA